MGLICNKCVVGLTALPAVSSAGEDTLLTCPKCGWTGNEEVLDGVSGTLGSESAFTEYLISLAKVILPAKLKR